MRRSCIFDIYAVSLPVEVNKPQKWVGSLCHEMRIQCPKELLKGGLPSSISEGFAWRMPPVAIGHPKSMSTLGGVLKQDSLQLVNWSTR